MSSPTESSSASNDKFESSKNPDGHFDAWGLKIPMPRWAIGGLGIMVLLGAMVSGFFKVVWPHLGRAQPVVVAASTLTNPPPPAQGHKISDADMIDYRESMRHGDEKPRTEKVILDSADLGLLKVKFFISDRCILVIRKSAGPNPATTSHYILAAKMEDQAPGKIDLGATLRYDSTFDRGMHEAQMLPASYHPNGEAPVVAPAGNCANPHAGEFRYWNAEQRGCWLQVWRQWPDGCKHYQWFNTCNGYWDSWPDGSPKVYWTNCVH